MAVQRGFQSGDVDIVRGRRKDAPSDGETGTGAQRGAGLVWGLSFRRGGRGRARSVHDQPLRVLPLRL